MNEKNYLHKKIKLVWMLPIFMILLVAWGILLIGLYLSQIADANAIPYGIAATAIILALSYIFTEFEYRHHYYEFGEASLRISHGLFTRYSDTIPYHKIQHIRAERTIFEHLLGVVHIHIEMAGVTNSETQPTIPGIPIEAYEEMIEFIKGKTGESKIGTDRKDIFCPPSKSQEEIMRLMLEELRLINKNLTGTGGAKTIRIVKKGRLSELNMGTKDDEIMTHL